MSEAAETPETAEAAAEQPTETADEQPAAGQTPASPMTAVAAAPAPASASSPGLETAPCYACGSTRGEPAGYRWWGPGSLMSEVRCLDCGRYYNSKTGDSNGPWILWWHMFVFLVGVSGAAAWLLAR